MMTNIIAAWVGFLLGCIAGTIPGMFFHSEDWLGGYNSWPRRMVRLAHISFFGIGIMNLSFGLTVRSLQVQSSTTASSGLLMIGAVTMPVVCYLSAAKRSFRHLFFIPALSVTLGVALFLWKIVIL